MPKKIDKTVEVMVVGKFGPERVGSIAKFKKGYVRNYLIPNGLCIRVKGNEDLIKAEMANWQKEYEANEVRDKKIIEQLKDLALTIKAESGFGGSLFGSINSATIVKELGDKGIEIARKDVVVNPIKFLGDYEIEININGVRCPIKLHIVPVGNA